MANVNTKAHTTLHSETFRTYMQLHDEAIKTAQACRKAKEPDLARFYYNAASIYKMRARGL